MIYEQEYRVLYNACMKGNVRKVLEWIEKYRDTCSNCCEVIAMLGRTDYMWRTPVNIAAANGHADVVKVLLEWGVDCNLSCRNHVETPLHSAVRSISLETVELLLTKGTGGCATCRPDILRSSCVSKENCTPLMLAIKNRYYDIIELLLKHVDIDATDYHGRTALHVACHEGDAKIVKMLVDAKANVNAANIIGSTPLHVMSDHLVSKSWHEESVAILLDAGADVDKMNRDGVTPLHVAFMNDHISIAKLMLRYSTKPDTVDDCGNTYLHCALGFDVPLVLEVLALGVNVNQRNNKGKTPLWFAIRKGCDIHVIKTLLLAGADPDIVDNKGKSVRTFDGNLLYFPTMELLDLMPLPLQSLTQMQVQIEEARVKRQRVG